MNKLPQKIEQLLNFHVLGLRPQHSAPQQGTANGDKSDLRKYMKKHNKADFAIFWLF